MMHRASIPAFLLAAVIPGTAAQAAQTMELSLKGEGPYYSVTIPLSLRTRSSSPELRDLQVLNARSEPIPFAWVEALPGTVQESEQVVPVFKVPGPASGNKATASRSWMLDTRAVKGGMLSLALNLPETVRGVYSLRVEVSDDMQQWHQVQDAAQVVSLEHQGQQLVSMSIDMAGSRGKYVRLTALNRSLLPELKEASVTSVVEQSELRPVQWSDAIAPTACAADHCDYAIPKNVPLEQVRWQLAEPNTLARVTVLGQVDAAIAPEVHERYHSRHHHLLLHHPLRKLREKSSPPPQTTPSPQWAELQSATVYWLRPSEGEVRSGPQWLSGGFYSGLRIQTQGPITQLGSTPPMLRVGARTPMLVMLARGPGPYRLQMTDDPRAASGAMSLADMMPSRKPADPLPADTASVIESAPPVMTPAPVKPPSVSPTAAPVKGESKTIWLWAALLAGLAAMGGMAWTLLKKPTAT
jgi:hypothetical protein